MALFVAETSLVSPLGLSPAEHVFFWRAEVAPFTSGAFTTRDGEALPVHDCPWIPAIRPWSSRVRLLAMLALARVRPSSRNTPILLVASSDVLEGEVNLRRFLELSGHSIAGVVSGSASYVRALLSAEELLRKSPEVIVLAVDSLLSEASLSRWFRARRSGFTRNPLPPSEGAAAMRLVVSSQPPLAGKIHASSFRLSESTDDNDRPADGVALGQVFADLPLPARVPLLVGPRDVDPLRIRDMHIVSVHHHQRLDRAEMPSLEGRMGVLGSAAGLMSAVFAMAWLRHSLPLPDSSQKDLALAWARSRDGGVGAVLVGDERS